MSIAISLGSMPNFDSSQTVLYPDMSEMTFKQGAQSNDRGLVRQVHSAKVTASGKQPGVATFVSAQPQGSGLAKIIVGSNTSLVRTDSETGLVTWAAPQALQIAGTINLQEESAEIFAQRVLFTLALVIPSFSSGNAATSRIWDLIRLETNILPNG
jgi:hypothetical protein